MTLYHLILFLCVAPLPCDQCIQSTLPMCSSVYLNNTFYPTQKQCLAAGLAIQARNSHLVSNYFCLEVP